MKLQEIQKKLKAPKSQRNNFGNYNYRNCEDILEAVKPLLGDSLLLISDEIVQLGERYYVKATATFIDHEPSAKDVGKLTTVVSAFARESLEKKGMDAAQITGAASSYARKYALNGLFLIDDTKDADTQDNASAARIEPYTVKRKIAAADDEAGGAVIQDDKQFLDREEIETVQKEHIKSLLGSHGHDDVTKAEAKKLVKKLTELALEPENYEEIIKRLRDGLDAIDPLATAILE